MSAAIIMGNTQNLHDDDIIAGTFFITFPAVLFIVTLFVPARWFSRRAAVAGGVAVTADIMKGSEQR